MNEFIISNSSIIEEFPKKKKLNIFLENTLFNNIFPELKAIIISYFKATKKHEKLSEYEKNNNYDKYFTTLIFMADRGCPISQKKILQDYMIGKNFLQDHEKNFAFYYENKDYPYSACYLGWMYFGGIYVSKNESVGSMYYKKAIELGNSIAMNNLAFQMCSSKNEKSIELFKKSATLGNPSAFWHLGEIYRSGKFGEINCELAKKYYVNAIKRGNVRQSEIMGILLDLYAKKN